MFKRFKIGIEFGGFGNDTLTGSDRKDLMFGLWGDDTLSAGAGRDKLFGGFGHDTLFGGADNDKLFGGAGDDTLDGGAGADRLYGGRGFVIASYDGSVADYDVSAKQRGHGVVRAEVTDADGATDRLIGVEALYFAADDYTAFLDGTNNAVLARDDAAGSDATGALIAGLTDNDFDFDGDALRITGIDTSALTGSATLNADGTISYSTDGAFEALAEGETAETTLTYTVTDDKGATATARVTITITGENDAPELTVTDATIDENTTEVTTATGFDIDGDALSFTISGADAALFTIDPATGALAFIDAPDFETRTDADADGIYDVTVTVSDGALTDSADIQVTVADVDEGPQPEYRINEIHYDNAGGDVGEFIEVRVTAGADVSGLALTLYNGNGGAPYGTAGLSAAPTGSDGAYDYYVVYIAGIQNGGPDGIALSNGEDLVEFLSYEGSFTGVGGRADGVPSTDIGVFEPGTTPVGFSLQRNDDGTWRAPEPETPGAANIAPVAQLVISEIMQNPSAVADSEGEYFEIHNAGPVAVDINGYTVSDNDSDLFVIDNGAPLEIPAGGYLVLGRNGATGENGGVPVDYVYGSAMALANSSDEIVITDTLGREVDRVEYDNGATFPDPNGAAMELTDLAADNNDGANWAAATEAFGDGDLGTPGAPNGGGGGGDIMLAINEFHYDNAGSDVGEFIELKGTPGGDLTGWTITLYNGNGGGSYGTLSPTGTLNAAGFATVSAPGLQNGSPDGFALVRPDGTVAEFLSYEGTLTASDGPAAGLTSTDVGASESSTTPVGQSLQKQADGSWALLAETPDAENNGVAPPPPPPSEIVAISAVQGAGDVAALDGQTVSVSAVVTAVVSNGFYLQEEDADTDADASTSEGIFVFTGAAPDVTISASYTVTGAVSEFFGLTQITAATIELLEASNPMPTTTGLTFPFTTDLEAVEGMLVSIAPAEATNPLTVIETFNFDRFGDLVLSDGPQIQPTQIFDPATQQADIQALIAENAATRLVIDDGVASQNPLSFHYIANTTAGDDGDGVLGAGDSFTADGPTVRIGAELNAPIEGVMSYGFGDFRVIPTETLSFDPATNEGARDGTAPDVGGDLKVVSFNALNYFTTLVGGRGARTEADLERQTEKLVNALVELDGDIVGLQEIENNGFGTGSAMAALVEALNDRLGTEVYGIVDPTGTGSPIGTDAITVGFIYKLDTVQVVASDFLIFEDGGQQRNRPAVAATFEEIATGEQITVANNHFKSKGPSGLDGQDPTTDPDVDQGDGQGFWNATRTDAANQLTDWLANDYAGTGDPDYLIIGDLNAYSQEDPVTAIEAAGYDNLLEQFIGAADAFSFVFDGQQGALDQALSTTSLRGQITGVEEWHINSLEPDLLSYNSRFTDPGFYNGGDVFAASDHDPLVIGLDLSGPAIEPVG